MSEMTAAPVFTFKKTKRFNGYLFNRERLGDLEDAVSRRAVTSLALINGGAQ